MPDPNEEEKPVEGEEEEEKKPENKYIPVEEDYTTCYWLSFKFSKSYYLNL